MLEHSYPKIPKKEKSILHHQKAILSILHNHF